jgi:DUF917 family protein
LPEYDILYAIPERRDSKVNKILFTVLTLVLASSLCYAAEMESEEATEPVGAVVEASGMFVGKVSSVVEDTMAGGKAKNYVTVSNETGQTKMFPVDDTVNIVDSAFNALTLDQLKMGQKVAVEYSEGSSGQEKATSITVEK